MTTMLAFTLAQAAVAAGVSEHQVRQWDEADVLVPSVARGESQRIGPLYTFRDVVGLRVLGLLRGRFDLSGEVLHRVGQRLQQSDDASWCALRFVNDGGRLVLRDSAESMEVVASLRTDQATQVALLDLETIAAQVASDARSLNRRAAAQIGVIERHIDVLGNQPVLAGTRIPTAAVWEFHEAGYTPDQIVAFYPKLTDTDVESALDSERDRRASAKRAS